MFRLQGTNLLRKIKSIFGFLIIGLCISYLYYEINNNWEKLNGKIEPINYLKATISIILFMIGQFLFSKGWAKIIQSNTNAILDFNYANYFWAVSGFGKYVPGRIWQFASRFYFFEKIGIQRVELLIMSAIEQLFYLYSALIITLIILYNSIFEYFKNKEIFLLCCSIIIMIGAFILSPSLMNYIMSKISRVIPSLCFQFKMSFSQSIRLFSYYFFGWIFIGCGFSFLTSSILKLSLQNQIFLIGANAGSYFLGYIVLFTPGGLGIREGVLAFFCDLFIFDGIGAVLAILSRIWYIIGEILYYIISFINFKRKEF